MKLSLEKLSIKVEDMKEILIIDDSDFIHEALIENIREDYELCGVRIHSATSSEEGINKLKNEDINLVICDFEMPEGNGLLVLDYIEKENLPVKLIFFTGRHHIGEIEARSPYKVIYNKSFTNLLKALKDL